MADVTLGSTSMNSLGETTLATSSGTATIEAGVAPVEGSVSYDTHKRLLGEKKKLQERLEQFESQAKQKQEEDLKSQNQYKLLYDNALKERESLSKKLEDNDQRWNNAIKLDSFMNSLNGRKIEAKYAGFINLDQILLDPESGQVDALSVQREVERICKEFPEIVKGATAPKGVPNLPAQNPLGSGQSIRPLTAQERIKASAAALVNTYKK